MAYLIEIKKQLAVAMLPQAQRRTVLWISQKN
jgi:hypothetical protein